MKTLHIISGLPRSGSTLLATLLRQNPRFDTSITSPILTLIQEILPLMSGRRPTAAQFDGKQRLDVLRGIISGYYNASSEVAFDTNRGWTARMALLHQLYPDAKVVCCVRRIPDILNSLEAAIHCHPAHHPTLVEGEDKRYNTQYSRVAAYMNLNHGLVGFAWAALREAWFGPFASRLIIVPYERFVQDPQASLDRLYACLEQIPFRHTFENLQSRHESYDDLLGLPGLHAVKPHIERQKTPNLLLPDLRLKYSNHDFWESEDASARGIFVV